MTAMTWFKIINYMCGLFLVCRPSFSLSSSWVLETDAWYRQSGIKEIQRYISTTNLVGFKCPLDTSVCSFASIKIKQLRQTHVFRFVHVYKNKHLFALNIKKQ